jgi:microcystin synthetase protein McyJ
MFCFVQVSARQRSATLIVPGFLWFLAGVLIGIAVRELAVVDWCVTWFKNRLFGNPTDEPFDLSDRILNYPLEPQSSWGNLGYWPTASTFPEAGQALAKLVGNTAQLTTSDRLLDLGFGCGDQLSVWLEHFGIKSVFGLNPSTSQFHLAQQKLAPYVTAKRLQLECSQAETITNRNDSFDAVIALDAAYHFDTRFDVLAAAYQRLVPGGRLVFTDILTSANSAGCPLWLKKIFAYGDLPEANLISETQLHQQLASLGFGEITITDITANVMGGMQHFLEQFLNRWRCELRPARLLRYEMTRRLLRLGQKQGPLIYVIYSARKPW